MNKETYNLVKLLRDNADGLETCDIGFGDKPIKGNIPRQMREAAHRLENVCTEPMADLVGAFVTGVLIGVTATFLMFTVSLGVIA